MAKIVTRLVFALQSGSCACRGWVRSDGNTFYRLWKTKPPAASGKELQVTFSMLGRLMVIRFLSSRRKARPS